MQHYVEKIRVVVTVCLFSFVKIPYLQLSDVDSHLHCSVSLILNFVNILFIPEMITGCSLFSPLFILRVDLNKGLDSLV